MTVAAYHCLESAQKGDVRRSPAFFPDVSRTLMRALVPGAFLVLAVEKLSRELHDLEAAG